MAKTKLMRTVVDCETNEIVEREFTAEEYAQKEIDTQKQLSLKVEDKAQATAKAELLDRLGITEDEARLLLG
jgi:hypothetical protein